MMPFCHFSAGLLLGAVLAPSLPLLASCAIGGILPDRLDAMQARDYDRESFFSVHRGWSHNLGLWLTICLLFFFLRRICPPELVLLLLVGIWGCFGILCHLALDILNPTGIPVIPFLNKKRLSLARIRTGSWLDYLLGCLFFSGGIFLILYRLNTFPLLSLDMNISLPLHSLRFL